MAGGIAGSVSAAGTNPPTISHKRQVSECMTRQMSMSRTLSYNEASRLCKAQLKSQSAALTATAAKPGTSR